MRRLLKLLRRFTYERRRYLFYGYGSRQGLGYLDPHVKTYDSWTEIPRHIREMAVPNPWMNVMYYRLQRGQARLLCYSETGARLDAYGWIQDWRPFRRRFGVIAARGSMLGYYWTAPDMRGRGLYGRLLAHSIYLCPKDQPILIDTSPKNRASQRGIEKAGFEFLGEWEERVFFRWFSKMRRIPRPDEKVPHELC